jgi:hypothetical protein
MRFLKQLQLNRRDVKDQRVSALGTGEILLKSNKSVRLPYGATSDIDRNTGLIPGRMRYNTDTGNVEVYQGDSWRALRYKESGTIVQQNLGAGDNDTVYFGPLNAAYHNKIASDNSTYGGQNILVIVENVIQLSDINYTVVNSTGTISAETYLPKLSVAATTSSTVLYFNSAVFITGGTAVGTAVTLTVANTTGQPPFAVGSYIQVTGCSDSTNQTNTPYNGTYLVTGSSATTVSYTATSAPGTWKTGGQATACTSAGLINATFPSNPSLLTGVTITASGLYSPTTITDYTLDSNTDALTSITISHVPTGSIGINTTITITESSSSVSGYYLKFADPVPLGKVVIALIGFDQ